MLQHTNVGNSVEISLVRDGKAIRTYKSKMEDPSDPNSVLIQVPSVQGQLVKLPKSDSYEMLVFAEDKLIKFKAKLTGYTKQDGFMYCVLKMLSKGEKVQRREYFRYTTQMPLTFFIKEEGEKDFNTWELVTGLIKDIGGGGIRFVSNKELTKNDQLKVFVCLNNNLFVANCKILFIDPTPEASIYNHQYRVQFLDTFEAERELIVQYIFNEQRRILSKNRR